MTVDISKIKPGDKVTLVPLEVHGTLQTVIRDTKQIKVRDADGTVVYFNLDQIAAHHPTPREFQVGDRVRTGGISRDAMTIIAMDGDETWVKATSGRNFTARTSDLTLVEGGE